MPTPPDRSRYFDKVVLLGLLSLFLFASPLVDWWSARDMPWYAPFLLWAVVILLGAMLHRAYRGRN